MGKKVTIKDVAKEAGVSIGTVDRILHNRGRFSKDTAIEVQNAIKKLNYKPLDKKSTEITIKNNHKKIGICLLSSNNDYFWQQAKSGVLAARKELSLSGIELITDTFSYPDTQTQLASIRRLLQSGVNAIIAPSCSSNDYDKTFAPYLPSNFPFATFVSSEWSRDFLFHIGPNDEAIGSTIAKLIALYCGATSNVVILAPYPELEGVQKRITGFAKKIALELKQMKILQIYPIIAQTAEQMKLNIYNETIHFLDMYPELNALYITNGALTTCAEAIRQKNSSVRIFGHEYTEELPSLFDEGIVCATVYQNPAREIHDAIFLMANYLLRGERPNQYVTAECNILTKETLPLLRF